MALIVPPAFHGAAGNAFAAARLRRVNQTLLGDREGPVGEQDMLVLADSPASLRVQVLPGRFWVNGDSVARQGAYLIENDATMFSSYVGAAHATLPRIDLLVLRDYDSAADGGSAATDAPVLEIVAGGANASPVAPPVPPNSIPLAELRINAASATITTITDRRPWAHFSSPANNLLGNAWLDQWSRGTAAAPDGWNVFAGTCAQFAGADGAPYGALVTAPLNTGVTLVYRLSAVSGVDPVLVSLRGRVLTFTARVYATVAGRVRLALYDGVGAAASAYHSGSGLFETLTCQLTVGATATANAYAYLEVASGPATTPILAKPSVVMGSRSSPQILPPPPPGLSELNSERVYERMKGTHNAYNVTGGLPYVPISFHTRKAGIPTVTASALIYNNASAVQTTDLTVDGYSFGFLVTSTGQAGVQTNVDAVV